MEGLIDNDFNDAWMESINNNDEEQNFDDTWMEFINNDDVEQNFDNALMAFIKVAIGFWYNKT